MPPSAPPILDGFTHVPGHHCGSTAIADLVRFHGTPISEELAFGLGAGAGFCYFELDEGTLPRYTNGRSPRLEEQFVEITGAPIEKLTFDGPEQAWDATRATIDSGRPAILNTDLFYLDYYGNSVHFPGHAVVICGYDDELAYLADTSFEEIQRTTLESLAAARHGDHPFFALRGHMYAIPADASIGRDDLIARSADATAHAAREMFEPSVERNGFPALEEFAGGVAGWPEETGDWKWAARFNYQCIERRGTGGGNFRRLYSRFLDEAGQPGSAEATAAADRWTELAAAFFEASETDSPDPAGWRRIGDLAAAALEAERRLWDLLA